MRVRSSSLFLSAPVVFSFLGRVASVLFLALFAWLCAQIFWAVKTPLAQAVAQRWETDGARAAQGLAGRHLFGQAALAPVAMAAPTDIRLSGVIAAQVPGEVAMAFLALDGKPPQVVREGEDVAPGIQLQKVLPRQVELLRAGQVQTLDLPERGKP